MNAIWPADKIERLPISVPIVYERNARTHSGAQVKQLVESIREWGFTMPILLDEKDVVIAGHGRLAAAKLMKLDEIPTMRAVGWTAKQINAYRIADNKLAMNAAWDTKLLRAELESLGNDVLPLIGFSATELRRFGAADGTKNPDEETEAVVNPISKHGDIWLCGGHRIMCGDSTSPADVEKLFGEDSPDLMVTDPPYGVDYDPDWREQAGLNVHESFSAGKVTNDHQADWREAYALFSGDIAYVWHAGVHVAEVQDSLEAVGFRIRSQIIWAKQHFVISRGDYHWQHEPCWYAARGGEETWHGDKTQSTLWQISNNGAFGGGGEEKSGHSTQKPVECMRRPIANSSEVGSGVYDPFLGSGTTIIAAEMEGRRGFGMDILPAYVDAAVRRWEAFTGQQATLQK